MRALLLAVLLLPLAQAHTAGGAPDFDAVAPMPVPSEPYPELRPERPCPALSYAQPAWRDAMTLHGVDILPSRQCHPDNPHAVAAFVRGTNNVPEQELLDMGLHPDAVRKHSDLDGDGDPDVIEITLEVIELNGWHLEDDAIASPPFEIAPGVETGFWVFAPKTTRYHSGFVDQFWRMPSAPIRVEQGDQVRITLENTHYLPHTIHLHGVDHPFQQPDGTGNDGVPIASEMATVPGNAHTYEFAARHPGTMFYHCHVHPHVHVQMGLNGAFIIEPQRPDNWVQTLNIGAGEVRAPSVSSREAYDREFDLHYQDVDRDLNDRIDDSNDPRELAWSLHNDYDVTDASSDYFLLNGRSFPYTMRESLITVEEEERIKLRVLNGGKETLSLHLHGHKPTATAYDGVDLLEVAQVQRDVFTITAAQRVDLELNTVNNGLDSYGPGVWFAHDHRENAVTTDGIGPGGDITQVVYLGFQDERTMLPTTNAMGWDLFFTDAYYRGEVPVFGAMDNDIWGRPAEAEEAPAPFLAGMLALIVLAWRRR
ncbi:MAG: multicopper oxidase domain-containing protein [Thermoplasmatota archaeon]